MLRNKLQKKNLLILNLLIYLNFFLIKSSFAKSDLKSEVIERAQKSMLIIEIRSSITTGIPDLGGYKELTGAIIDKEKGIIITRNSTHTIIISSYRVRFFNGIESEAKFIYKDPWIGFCFLKVDPKIIPKNIKQINFVNRNPKMNQKIFVLDNCGQNSFSVQKGIISNLNVLYNDLLPQQFFNLSMNTSVSHNISPVFNQNGDTIGLKMIGGDTHALALHPEYIRYALKSIRQNKKPIRKHIGVITKMYSLAQGFKMRKFPKKKLYDHAKKFGKSRTEAIEVISTLKGSPSENKLLNGDIIWAINGKRIGPNLVDFDMAMNNSKTNKIKLTILRNTLEEIDTKTQNKILKTKWKEINLEIELYNLEVNKIKSFLTFGDYILFEADDIHCNFLGIPLKTLILKQFSLGYDYSDQSNKILVKNIILKKINNKKINSLQDFLIIFNELKKIKTFSLEGHIYDLQSFFKDKGIRKIDMFLDKDVNLKHYNFDEKSMGWKSKTIK